MKYYADVGRSRPCDVLYVRECPRGTAAIEGVAWGRSLGFDVGYYEGEGDANVARSYIQDGVLGASEELKRYKEVLNEHYLLTSSGAAWRIADRVVQLVAEGVDPLESYIPDSGVTVFEVSSAVPWVAGPIDQTPTADGE